MNGELGGLPQKFLGSKLRTPQSFIKIVTPQNVSLYCNWCYPRKI
jgi:hypothetical protein